MHINSSLADKPLQLSKTYRRWRGMTSAAPFHAGPLHLNSSALSRAGSSMPDDVEFPRFPGLRSAKQPKLRGVFSTRAPGVGGMWGHVKCPEPRHEIPVPPTRTAANPCVCWPLTLGPSPRLLSEGVQFAISIPVDDDARLSSTTTCHDTPLENTDDTAQEGLAARSSCTSIGRIVSVRDRLSQQRRQTTSIPSTSPNRMSP